MITEGAIIGKKYILVEKISEGGGGVVWKAKDKSPLPPFEKGGDAKTPPFEKGGMGGIYVALKILKWSPLKSKGLSTERFKREFDFFKKASHPNIARIYDFGCDAENDLYYFTSELLTGGDLRALIEAPVSLTERLLLQALRALEYLRSFRILHLDIKPQNLLLRHDVKSILSNPDELSDDCLALIDFGLAGFNPPERPGGTPNYMPPEVVVRRLQIPPSPPLEKGGAQEIPPFEKGGQGGFSPPDHKSDLYSLGAAFYFALTGRQPFAVLDKQGKIDVEETMKRHLSEKPPHPPSFYNKDVEPYLDYIIMRMMARKPFERYQTALLAAQALCFRSPNRLKPESRETIGAYLPEEGMLIGRHKEKSALEELILDAAKRLGGAVPIACIVGCAGTGKTRMLSALKPFAQQQEMEVITNLIYEDADIKSPRAFLIDDPFLPSASIDISSLPAAFALKHVVRHILKMPRSQRFLAFTLDPDLLPLKQVLAYLELEASLCTIIRLKNFTVEEINEYLKHLLGEDPSSKIADELYHATFGNPRFISDCFKRMIERGELFSYFSGRPAADTLSSVGFSFSHVASPPSLAEHLLGLVKELPAGARGLARALACWKRDVGITELEGTTSGTSDEDFEALISSDLVRPSREKKGFFEFSNPLAAKIIESNLDPKERASIHDAIAMYLRKIPPFPPLEKGGAQEIPPFEKGGQGGFELDLHLAFGSNKKLQKEAVERLSTTVLGRLHPSQAAELFHEIFDVLPEKEWALRAQALVREGQALAKVGRWDDAKKIFEKIPTLCTEDNTQFILTMRSAEQLGLLALRRRELSLARAILSKAVDDVKKNTRHGKRATPHSLVLLLRLENYLAAVDLREGNYKAAEKTYVRTDKLRAALPPELNLQITNNELGETLLLLGRTSEAVNMILGELERAKKAGHFERTVNRLRLLGDAYRREGDYDKSREYYEQALGDARRYHLFEHQLRIRNGLANLLMHTDKWDEAIEHYKPALDLAMRLEGKATSVDIMANIGFAYNKLARFDDAIEYLELALDFAKGPEAESSAQIKSSIPSIHVTLGNAHYEKKEYDEALKHLNIALLHDKQNPLNNLVRYNLYGTLAEIYLARGELQKAREHLQILQELASHLPEAKPHLRELMEKMGSVLNI